MLYGRGTVVEGLIVVEGKLEGDVVVVDVGGEI